MSPTAAPPLTSDMTSGTEQLELELLIREARARQRRRRLRALVGLLAAVAVPVVIQAVTPAPGLGSLLSRPLQLPALGSGGRCPVSSGYAVDNPLFVGDALGRGPVRVLLADAGDIRHGRVRLGTRAAPGWFALQTLWFALPGYGGPFVVRGARLGRPGQIEVQPGDAGRSPGSGPLLVPAGPTQNAEDGYRTVPGSTWIRSPGCYTWQVDGRGFSEHIVIDALR